MSTELIHDRGRGPELIGTRITVYDLLPNFLDPDATEAYICRLYELTPDQVAAARAYVLQNPDTVLAQHLKIEERLAIGNPPEVRETAKRVHATFLKFKAWMEQRKAAEAKWAEENSQTSETATPAFPTFREWLMSEESQPLERL